MMIETGFFSAKQPICSLIYLLWHKIISFGIEKYTSVQQHIFSNYFDQTFAHQFMLCAAAVSAAASVADSSSKSIIVLKHHGRHALGILCRADS